MVLVKMLMEIDPLSMRGSMVVTMAVVSPSQRDVSPIEQLRRSPRLVLPRFRLKTAALRPESFLMIFFQGDRLHIAKDGHRRPVRGAMRQGAHPHPRGSWVPPSGASFTQYFLYTLKHSPVKFQEFWSCVIGL